MVWSRLNWAHVHVSLWSSLFVFLLLFSEYALVEYIREAMTVCFIIDFGQGLPKRVFRYTKSLLVVFGEIAQPVSCKGIRVLLVLIGKFLLSAHLICLFSQREIFSFSIDFVLDVCVDICLF